MNSNSEYAKVKWAEKIGVSTSGYYTWLRERAQRQAVEDTRREKVIAAFNDGQGVYGADRICGILRRDGYSASYPVVRCIMSQEGLKSSHCRRRQWSMTDSRKALKLFQEQNKLVRKEDSRERREEEKDRHYELHREKAKEKHKGH